MKTTDKIFIAGHNGLVGKATFDLLKKKGFKNLITVNRKKLDLRDKLKVAKYFKNKKIDYMVMAAARAGGIIANSTNQKDFFLENVEIQNSLLNLALEKKIKRTIFLGTSCIYPKFSKTPIKEESLLTGKLEKTNQELYEPYRQTLQNYLGQTNVPSAKGFYNYLLENDIPLTLEKLNVPGKSVRYKPPQLRQNKNISTETLVMPKLCPYKYFG